ncbi:cysteine hydrolase family protein [Streptomyces sp. NPDC058457]|uniref:cysteine hydrolase family protein n=1 Tax=Streptomyces sp. NPDC058457 TaxID=3346507 RepID=UPI00364EAEDE
MGNAVVIVCDMQNDIARFHTGGEEMERLITAIKELTDWAREQGITVVYSCVGYRPGYVDVIPQLADQLKRHKLLAEGTWGTAVLDGLAPQDGDVMLMRRRSSSFYGTDLDLVLKALDADTVILTGVSTHRVVESTARDASDRDLRVLVASDCCGSNDQEFHDASLRAIADWFGKVHTSEEIMKELAS